MIGGKDGVFAGPCSIWAWLRSVSFHIDLYGQCVWEDAQVGERNQLLRRLSAVARPLASFFVLSFMECKGIENKEPAELANYLLL